MRPLSPTRGERLAAAMIIALAAISIGLFGLYGKEVVTAQARAITQGASS